MTAVLNGSDKPRAAPDLSEYRKRYPLTVASFGSLAGREAWLDRIWKLESEWRLGLEQNGGAREAIVRGSPPSGLTLEGEFEIIYAGGVVGLLHAATMCSLYKRRVMVFEPGTIGRTGRTWNISSDDLEGFERARLFTKEEVEAYVVNRCRSGFVKFHDGGSRLKTPPLWVDGVLDVSVEADKLLAAAGAKFEASQTNSVLMSGQRFVRCYVQRDGVSVEVEDKRTGKHSLFRARLFVDATTANSGVSRQLNDAHAITHVRPMVGTISRGLMRGAEPDQVDFTVGEILVSNQDARDHRQLIWEGFAASPARDEYATYLFFYDAVNSPAEKSLLELFERYFEQLPSYKRTGAQWRVVKPVFGYTPILQNRGLGEHRRCTADDRVILIGDAAGLLNPLTFDGFGLHVRNLQCQTHLIELALKADMLDRSSLAEINALTPRGARLSGFAEFLRPAPKSAASNVNETLNAVMAALHSLDEGVRRELFQDRMTLSALKRLFSRTVQLYPRIFQRLREHLGARGTLWWLAGITASAFSERLRSRLLPEGDVRTDESARTFTRYVESLKNRNGANGQR